MAKKKDVSLGKFLKQCREDIERPLRWVADESKRRHPDDKEMQISNGYLYQLEDEQNFSPHPLKLKTLAEIYQTDYIHLLQIAGYLDSPQSDNGGDFDPGLIKKFQKLPVATQQSIIKIMDELIDQFESAK